MMDSPLKWAGSKRWHVPNVRHEFESFSYKARLVEPFCGGLSIALGVSPQRALLNDANPHLINFWRYVQVGEGLPLMPFDDANYSDVRRDFNLCQPDGIVQASRFFWLNQRCFNGIWRVNSQGEFNVPPRPYRADRTHPEPDWQALGKVMRDWEFMCGDFQSVMTEPGDFIYADPPYDDGFTSYTEGGFSWADQQRLAIWLSVHDGPVMLMNKATERILHLYHSLGFHVELVDAPQRMQHSQGRTDKILEVIASK